MCGAHKKGEKKGGHVHTESKDSLGERVRRKVSNRAAKLLWLGLKKGDEGV